MQIRHEPITLFDWSVPTNIDVKVLKILIPARPRHQPYAASRLRTPGKRFRRCWPDSHCF